MRPDHAPDSLVQSEVSACPLCGGVLELVTDGTVEVPYAPAFHRRDAPIPTQLVARPFWACTACEHCTATTWQEIGR